MYYLFKEKNILPNIYYNLREGEKIVVRAFFEYDMDLRTKEFEELERKRRLEDLKNR